MRTSSVPTVKPQKIKAAGGMMKYGMIICCTVMLAPLALYFAQRGTVTGLSSSLGLFAPLVLCVGAHVAMFVFMGRSCHGGGNKQEQPAEAAPAEERASRVYARR